MAIDFVGSAKQAAATFAMHMKTFVLPLAVGVFVISVVCAILPNSISKHVQA